MKRKYVLKRRAQRQEETRRRIVEAALELHRTLGPAETSLAAIAALAGVQRHTLHRHFPDQEALFTACTSHFLSQHPPPDTASWPEIPDPARRLRHGLAELFADYDANREMIDRVLRDSEKVPVGGGFARLQAAAEALGEGWGEGIVDDGRRLAALRLATSFACWRTLVRDAGLGSDQAAGLMATLVGCAAGLAGAGPRPEPGHTGRRRARSRRGDGGHV